MQNEWWRTVQIQPYGIDKHILFLPTQLVVHFTISRSPSNVEYSHSLMMLNWMLIPHNQKKKKAAFSQYSDIAANASTKEVAGMHSLWVKTIVKLHIAYGQKHSIFTLGILCKQRNALLVFEKPWFTICQKLLCSDVVFLTPTRTHESSINWKKIRWNTFLYKSLMVM